MPQNDDSKGVTVSVKIYERLLAAYPANFRREYGPAMLQLFRDQCRDAWSAGRRGGLAGLWLRVLLDWAKTSVVEHLLNMHRKESLLMDIFRVFLTDPRPRAAFIRVFALVFGGALICSAMVAYLFPRVYSGTVQIQVEKDYPEVSADHSFLVTQFKIIESYRILTNVIVNLHLDEKLALQHGAKRWTIDDTFDYLVHRLSVQQTRMSSVIEISVTNSDPELAAHIANATVDSYKLYRLDKWKQIQLWEPEESRTIIFPVIVCNPARPERESFLHTDWRRFLLYVLGGTLAALLAGGSAWFARQRRAR
jgi:hypothetical protein